jgi:hypothetical protein
MPSLSLVLLFRYSRKYQQIGCETLIALLKTTHQADLNHYSHQCLVLQMFIQYLKEMQ